MSDYCRCCGDTRAELARQKRTATLCWHCIFVNGKEFGFSKGEDWIITKQAVND